MIEWTNVSLAVNGGELFDDVAELRYEERPPPRPSLGPVSYTASCTFEMDRAAVERLILALTPNRRGVTEATLWRRAWYGGRKGRRAWRRLLAMARAAPR